MYIVHTLFFYYSHTIILLYYMVIIMYIQIGEHTKYRFILL